MNIEAVEKLLDETAEARAYQRVRIPFSVHANGTNTIPQPQEIDEMLANTLTAEDEDAVQAELRQLQQEAVRAFLSTGLNVTLIQSQLGVRTSMERTELPSVPTGKPASKDTEGMFSNFCGHTSPRILNGFTETYVPVPERKRIPVSA